MMDVYMTETATLCCAGFVSGLHWSQSVNVRCACFNDGGIYWFEVIPQSLSYSALLQRRVQLTIHLLIDLTFKTTPVRYGENSSNGQGICSRQGRKPVVPKPRVYQARQYSQRRLAPSEGWHLLKAYLDGEKHAYAKVVSDFLKAVSQLELEKAFGEIMGCEDDDEEGQKVLQAMLQTKLAESETQEGPKIPKRKTTFHPKFFEEDSASRRPICDPTPFSPAHSSSPTATPGTACPYHTMGLPSSSIPPTSPCPIPSVSGHSLSTLEKPESLLLEEVDNVIHLDGHEQALPNDQGSVASNKPDDPGHSTAVVKSNRALEISVASNKGEGEGEGEREGEREGKEKGKGKGKGKKGDDISKVPEDDVDEPSGQSGEENEEMDKKRGRLSKELKAQALVLRQQYHGDLEALAVKEEKTAADSASLMQKITISVAARFAKDHDNL
ncbi:hypothetical protein BT96DRAFT_942213 [Gymnopus androsaceus JB14]|uniref:Uncharacterized protein n=1 Tax=Gymnopus androsaceus JB14 TaxID=1447944 RepID=A0A6A4HBK1_9AGAR|nr:hypothetical protein BT96DRAFT_942213 [Gymnopus androsaceus JB14]